jgi:tellurite resistance protein TerC
VFAILGLRALFFALVGLMNLFRYLHQGLAAILIFIGSKMMLEPWWEIPTGASLGTVGGILMISIVASWMNPEQHDNA